MVPSARASQVAAAGAAPRLAGGGLPPFGGRVGRGSVQGGRLGMGQVEPGGLAPVDRLRLPVLRLGRPQRPLDVPQLLAHLPAVVARGRLGEAVGGKVNRRSLDRRLVGVGADRLPAPGTAERLLVGRWQRRHILAAVFAPHGVLSIGRKIGKLYGFRRLYRPDGMQTGKMGAMGNV